MMQVLGYDFMPKPEFWFREHFRSKNLVGSPLGITTHMRMITMY